MSKIKNDQGELISLLKKKKYMDAWEKVKYIGYKIEPDPENRFIIFNYIIKKFDPYKNNNFIKYFMDNLKFYSFKNDKDYIIAKNYIQNNKLKNYYISPKKESKYIEALSKIHP